MAASAYHLPDDKRDNKRQRLLLTATMLDERGEHKVHLLNISHNGAKLDTEEPPAPDSAVTLIHGELTVAARVAWVEGNRFGIAFHRPIDERHLVLRGQQHLSG